MQAEVFYHTSPEREDAMAPFSFGRADAPLTGGMYRFVSSFAVVEASADQAEVLWRAMNVVKGDEAPTLLGCRSMCTGDLVVFRKGSGTETYVARNAGFQKVELQPEPGTRTFQVGG